MQETTQRPLYVFMVVDKGIPSSQALQYLTTILTAGSGQREPPRLVFEVGGTSTLQATLPGKLKSQAACKVEVPHTSSTSLGGSSWPNPAV